MTYGSNLDLHDEVWDTDGNQLSLERDIYPNYDIILCISTYSATAPLTAQCKITASAAPPCTASTTSSSAPASPSTTTRSPTMPKNSASP